MALDISVIVGSILMAIGGLLVLIGLVLCYTTKVSMKTFFLAALQSAKMKGFGNVLLPTTQFQTEQ